MRVLSIIAWCLNLDWIAIKWPTFILWAKRIGRLVLSALCLFTIGIIGWVVLSPGAYLVFAYVVLATALWFVATIGATYKWSE